VESAGYFAMDLQKFIETEQWRVNGGGYPCVQRIAASPLAKAGAVCQASSGLAVVVVQPPPLSHTLGRHIVNFDHLEDPRDARLSDLSLLDPCTGHGSMYIIT
jgi:hypothetical protein